MSLPQSLNYQLTKSNAVASMSSTYEVTPVSGLTFSAGTVTSFDIPCGTKSRFLSPQDTTLRFTVTPTLTAGTTPTWQAIGPNFIQSITLWSSAGSVLLETIDNYGALWHLLRDITSDATMWGRDSITLGASSSVQRASASQNSGTSVTYQMPLLSVISLFSADRAYLPICDLNSPLRLEITWASAAQALACTGSPTAVAFTVSDAVLSCGMLTIADQAAAQIKSMVGQDGYLLHSTGWRVFRQTHTAGALSNSIQIPARYTSVRGILNIIRDSSKLENKDAYSVGERIRNYLTAYRVRVGSDFLTNTPVPTTGTATQAYMELRRVFSALTSESLGGLINSDNWAKDASTTVAANAVTGAFAIGSECQPFSNVAEKILSGLNSTANPIFVDLTFTGSPVASTIDSYVEYDALFRFNASGLGGLDVQY